MPRPRLLPEGALGTLLVPCPDCDTPVLITTGEGRVQLVVCVCCGATFTMTRIGDSDG